MEQNGDSCEGVADMKAFKLIVFRFADFRPEPKSENRSGLHERQRYRWIPGPNTQDLLKSYRLPSFENEFHGTPLVPFPCRLPSMEHRAVSIVGKSGPLSIDAAESDKGWGTELQPRGGRRAIGARSSATCNT